MPSITLTFNQDINFSCQIYDYAYYVSTASNSGFQINSNNIIEIGQITNLNQTNNTITCNSLLTPAEYPSVGDFILFSKDNKANLSSILGYFAEAELKNNSTNKAEMFAVSADYFESSK